MIHRHLWSHVLVTQMNARGISPRALAQATKLGKTTLERLCDPDDSSTPRPETLRALIHASCENILLDDEGLTARLWDDAAQVIDWMNLLGWRGFDTLCALRDDAARVAAERGWWRPVRGIPQPTPVYLPRDLEPDLQRAVMMPQRFRCPRYGAIFAPSESSAEAHDLVAHLMNTDAEWRDHFRDGMYWLEAKGLDVRAASRALVEMLACEPQPTTLHQQAWWTWAAAPGRCALIVLNEPTREALTALVRGVGPQIQFIVITAQEMVSALGRIVGHDRIRVFHLTGYTANEVMRLAQARGLTLDAETQRELEYVRECLRGEPAALRVVLDVLTQEKTLAPCVIVPPLVTAGFLRAPVTSPHADAWLERSALLAQIREQLVTARAPLVVLQGPPAVGKKTLAAQVMHDPAVQLHFSDGMFRLPRAEGESNRETLTEHQIASIAARVNVPLDATLPRDEALRRMLAGQRCLLILEDWQHPASVRWLRECVAPPTAILVTTNYSVVADALDLARDSVIAMPPFSFAETEQYYRQRYARDGEPITAPDLRALQELHQLTRGNPLGLYLSFLRVRAQGWASVLERLRMPALARAGMVDELFQPLEMAYRALPVPTQALFARLGALPPLMWYDAGCLSALWQMDERWVSEHMNQLERDAGLTRSQREGDERVWTVHGQVLAYARVWYEQLDDAERRAAARWCERAVNLPAQQARYQQFRRAIRPDLRALFSPRTYRPPLARRGWARLAAFLFDPTYAVEWERLEAHARYFTAPEYLLGFRLRRIEIKVHRLLLALIATTLLVGGLSILVPAPAQGISPLVAWVGLACASGLTVLAVNMLFFLYQPLWLSLWQRAHRRMERIE